MERRRARLFARLYRLKQFGQLEIEAYERFLRRVEKAATDKELEDLEQITEKSVIRPWKRR